MSARMSRDIEGEGLDLDLFRVAHALGMTERAAHAAVESALRRSRWLKDPRQARVAAFRRLAQIFLGPPEPEQQPAGPAPEADPAAALRALAPRHRLALALVALSGLRHGEAASALHEGETAFAETLAQAREAFALRLAAKNGRPRLRLVE